MLYTPQYTAVEGRKTNIVWFSAECLTLSDTSWIWSTNNHRTSRTAQTSEKTCAVYVNVTCEWSGRLYILKRLGTSLLSCKPMLSLQHTRQNSGAPGSLWQRSSTLDQLWRLWILRLQPSGNGLLQYSKLKISSIHSIYCKSTSQWFLWERAIHIKTYSLSVSFLNIL